MVADKLRATRNPLRLYDILYSPEVTSRRRRRTLAKSPGRGELSPSETEIHVPLREKRFYRGLVRAVETAIFTQTNDRPGLGGERGKQNY